jgi:hypothetical protein
MKKEEEQIEPFHLISQVDIPEHLQCYLSLESMVDGIRDTEMEKISKFVQSQNQEFMVEAVQMMISFHDIRPLQRNLIRKLITTISSRFRLNLRYLIDYHPFLAFHLMKADGSSGLEEKRIEEEIDRIISHLPSYSAEEFKFLHSTGKPFNIKTPKCFQERFSAEDFEMEEVKECGYERKSLGGCLKFDDFEVLRALSTHPKFRFEQEILISVFDLPHGTNPEHQSLLSVSGFYGALQCFKYVLLNGCEVSSSVCEMSIKGGHLEIIGICEAEKGDFGRSLCGAVRYLRNEIADWLL